MKILPFMLVALVLGPAGVVAQTEDPARVADFARRFAEGQELEKQGKLVEARAVFDGILAEEPKAKGSLKEAGLVSMKLNEPLKANDYLEKLHALVPDYPMALEALIQINQSLKRDVKVALLLKQYRSLYEAGKVPNAYFVRERIPLDQGREIEVTQFFDYHAEPNYVWVANIYDSAHKLTRRFLLSYDPQVTQNLRAKDPKMANAEELLLVEHVIQGDRVKRLDVYRQFFILPEYGQFRNTLLAIVANTLKPIDSAPVDASL